jgi:hypothetical protein
MPGSRLLHVENEVMAGSSAIEWTGATWNPVTGCDRVSPGCAHCYALDLSARLKRMGQPKYQRDGERRSSGPGFGLTLHEDSLGLPLRWKRPRVIFVNPAHEPLPAPSAPSRAAGHGRGHHHSCGDPSRGREHKPALTVLGSTSWVPPTGR